MRPWLYKLRNLPAHLLVNLIIGLVRLLPARASYAMGRRLALAAWGVMPRWRCIGSITPSTRTVAAVSASD